MSDIVNDIGECWWSTRERFENP